MHFSSIIIAVITFFTIGVFHPIVIKGEYYFSCKIWPVFILLGVVFVAASLFVENTILSSCLGVIGCSCFWSIKELFEQRERVRKGWFPKNPKREKDTSDKAEEQQALVSLDS
ncbi:MAG: DUF4491 family protein [Clostridia bacterium]|nr:DUF4491 family protein [Clostridia bacterium]